MGHLYLVNTDPKKAADRKLKEGRNQKNYETIPRGTLTVLKQEHYHALGLRLHRQN